VPASLDRPIRVLIVDDSAVVRGILGRIVDSAPDMRVVTTACNGRDAIDALRLHTADVVLLDIEMPVMDGLTALPHLLTQSPGVRVLVASSITRQGATITMRALSLGAVDYVHKPTTRTGLVAGLEEVGAEIVQKIRAIAHRDPAELRGVAAANERPLPPVPTAEFEPQVLAIAASTGGPNALSAVISSLPGDFPLPVLVTQHMPPIFTTMFAQRLAREGRLPCSEAVDGATLEPGHVYVAPGDHHLTVRLAGVTRTPTVQVTRDPPEHHCRPAADPMFRSAAKAFGAGVLAVVLTGMGEDGRRGCEAVVQAGGRVIVQDEATSVVWGMPGSIVAAGVPCTVLPLGAIATHVTSLCCVRS
jgi:two-component system chemotaxis response regulator CheB